MKALQATDPDGNGNPDTLAQTIKFSYKFVFKNITIGNIASAIRLLNYLRKAEQGFDLYVSEDGVNFQTITVDGFGDPYNHGLRVFAVTDQGLCLALPIPSTARRCGSGARTADPRTSRITAARLSNELGGFLCFAQETYHIFGIDAAGDGHTPPWTYNYGVSVNEL